MLEILRFCILVVILGVASYHDMKSREIQDYLWMVGGGIGAILYVFDWHDIDNFVIFSMALGALVSLAAWRLFPMGQADVLAVLTCSVLCPVSFGMMNPAVIFFGGLVLEHIIAIFYNLRYNICDLLYNTLYSGVDSPWYIRVMAFYSVHRRRPHERFTFCAENNLSGTRRISLKTPAVDSEYETRTGVFVTWAVPAFPFMLAALLAASIVGALFW